MSVALSNRPDRQIEAELQMARDMVRRLNERLDAIERRLDEEMRVQRLEAERDVQARQGDRR